MFSLRRSAWLIAVGVLLACAPAARSDAWVSYKRDAFVGSTDVAAGVLLVRTIVV